MLINVMELLQHQHLPWQDGKKCDAYSLYLILMEPLFCLVLVEQAPDTWQQSLLSSHLSLPTDMGNLTKQHTCLESVLSFRFSCGSGSLCTRRFSLVREAKVVTHNNRKPAQCINLHFNMKIKNSKVYHRGCVDGFHVYNLTTEQNGHVLHIPRREDVPYNLLREVYEHLLECPIITCTILPEAIRKCLVVSYSSSTELEIGFKMGPTAAYLFISWRFMKPIQIWENHLALWSLSK